MNESTGNEIIPRLHHSRPTFKRYLTKERVKWQHGKKLPVKKRSRQTELSIT